MARMDPAKGKALILIVEDEPVVGLEIQTSLGRMGYATCPVISSGDKVMEAAMQYQPDIILMDIKLKSFTDGIDAAVRVRMVKEIPIIYMTAYSDLGMRERAERTHPDAYLLKPVDDEALRREIDAALGRRNRRAGDKHET